MCILRLAYAKTFAGYAGWFTASFLASSGANKLGGGGESWPPPYVNRSGPVVSDVCVSDVSSDPAAVSAAAAAAGPAPYHCSPRVTEIREPPVRVLSFSPLTVLCAAAAGAGPVTALPQGKLPQGRHRHGRLAGWRPGGEGPVQCGARVGEGLPCGGSLSWC